MNSARMLLLWLTLIIAVIAPTTLFAQSNYSCDCAADTLNCSDFASPADAQSCFWHCGSQGAGDIHKLDADMNAVACDVLAEPAAPASAPIAPTIEVIYLEPTPVPTGVYYYEVCSCGGDYYDCNTFSGPSHAQGCYDYCADKGFGDVHQMDPDSDGMACIATGGPSVIPSITFIPTATPSPYVPPTAVYIAPAPTATPMPYIPPTAAPVMPTAVPQYEVCACGSDYYDCDTFSGPSHAQGCYDYCAGQGFGDVHLMDPDGDGMACQVSASAFTVIETTAIPAVPTPMPTAVYVAPTPAPVQPTTVPVYIAPTVTPTPYIQPTVMPMTIAPTSTPFPYIPGLDANGKVANPEACVCDYDYYNCSSFNNRESAVACATHCSVLGYGDIHRLDQGGAKDVICEAEFDAEIDFNAFDIPGAVCDCSRDAYNCSDGSFQTQPEAQGCFNYCYYDIGVGDIHGLDGNDKDFMACESLPAPQ